MEKVSALGRKGKKAAAVGIFVAAMAVYFGVRLHASRVAESELRGTREPVVLAHRGLMRHAPENTLPAFAAAMELGLSIELDVHQTLDGQLIVIHDETVDRTTDGTGEIAIKTLTEIRRLDAGSWFHPRFAGLRVPTLEEVFQLILKRQPEPVTIALNIKVVSLGIEANIVRLVEKYQLFDQLFVFGQSADSSRRFEQASPKMRTTGIKIYGSEDFARALDDPSTDCLWVTFVPSRVEIARAHEKGKQVWLGFRIAGHRPDIWDESRANGIDGICTDWPLESRRHWRYDKKKARSWRGWVRRWSRSTGLLR